ncbi:MAG: MBL fold metallo-hydrolase [Lachnospiraceae bacterium]|nr:MBL fold metallo-hydrolase [Lachnospiraceae bacterium]
MKVTFLGTTVLLFDDGVDQILFDAHLTRPSLPRFLFGNLQTDEALVERVLGRCPMDRLKGIFISHSHYDHALDMPYLAKRTGAAVFGSSSALNVARGGNVPEAQLHDYAGGIAVTAVDNDTARMSGTGEAKGKAVANEGNSVSSLNANRVTPNQPIATYKVGRFTIDILPSVHSKPNAFNNDLGQTIDEPLVQPAKKKFFKEGGSFDFVVHHENEPACIIRPSFGFIPGEMDGHQAKVLFLGVAGLAKVDDNEKKRFYEETLDKVKPEVVVPVHWDCFFRSIEKAATGYPFFIENSKAVEAEIGKACRERGMAHKYLQPFASIEF